MLYVTTIDFGFFFYGKYVIISKYPCIHWLLNSYFVYYNTATKIFDYQLIIHKL